LYAPARTVSPEGRVPRLRAACGGRRQPGCDLHRSAAEL